MTSSSRSSTPFSFDSIDLDAVVSSVELRLAALGDALRQRDSAAIEVHAGELHGALALAISRFAHAARVGEVPAALRTRLMQASGHVAAQRESLARATAALDRAIEVLFPVDDHAVYAVPGGHQRPARTSVAQA